MSNSYIWLRKRSNYVISRILCSDKVMLTGKGDGREPFAREKGLFCRKGLTFTMKCAKFSWRKAETKTRAEASAAERESFWCEISG